MKIQKINLNQLKHYSLNCKKHNQKNIDAIKHSVVEFTQYKPLVISKRNFEIIVGNGTYQALKQLNFEYADCIILDLSEEQQKILNIADNKTSDLSVWNQNLIDKLKNFDSQLMNILNFDDKFLKKFEKIQKIKKQPIEFSEDDVILQSEQKILVSQNRKIKCPCCGRQFQL